MKKTTIYAGAVLALLLAAINHKAIAATVQGWFDFAEQSTIANPASGYRRLAFKSDGKLYARSSAGVETEIGAGGSSGWDPTDRTKLLIVEEFVNGSSANNSVGTHGWSSASYGSGSVDVNSTPIAGVPGYAGGVAHGTNADSGGLITLLSSDPSMVVNYDWTWEARVKLASTSNSRTWIGMGASAAVVPARFLGFRYDTSSSYADDTKSSTGRWVAQMCVSSGCTDTGGTYYVTSTQPNTSWHTYKIVKSSSTYTFSIDGTQVATFCSSGCDTTVTSMNGNASLGFFTLCFETGAGFTESYLDRYFLQVTGLSR